MQIRIEDKKTGEIRVYETIPNTTTKSGQPRKRFIGTVGPDGTLIPPAPRKRKSSPKGEPDLAALQEELQQKIARVEELKKEVEALNKKRDAFLTLLQNIAGILRDNTSPDPSKS